MADLATSAARSSQVRDVVSLYDRLAADVVRVGEADPGDAELSRWAEMSLRAEARWLDARQWSRWLSWCDDEATLWVPLQTDRPHPGTDQSLLLDDRRRLSERIWRFEDPNAWALCPPAFVTRSVSAVEAWRTDSGDVLVASTLSVQVVRNGSGWQTAGRQVHRLGQDGRLMGKTMLLPALANGTPHLGWLI